jgi:hypothetical protein
MLVSTFTLHPKTNIAKGELTVKESQSVLTLDLSHNIDGFSINTSDLNDQSGKSLFYDEFISSADLTQHQNPAKEFLLQQNLFTMENQRRTGLRFFAYLKN